MFKRIIVAMIIVAVAGTALAPSAVSATKPKAYKNCAALNRAFPNGLARTQSAASAAVFNAFAAPTLDARAFRLNAALDVDRDGLACPHQVAAQNLPFAWGNIRVMQAPPPPAGGCGQVPIMLTIQDPAYMGGMGVALYMLQGEETIIGYVPFQAFDPSGASEDLRPAGKYPLLMDICAQQHAPAGLAELGFVAEPYDPNQEHNFEVTSMLDGVGQGMLPYTFG